MGDCVYLASYVHIWGGGGVEIGNNVMIGTHSSITSITHDYRSVKPMTETIVSSPVRIGNDVWIGSNVTVLPGVTINDGAVIGAGAVVTHDVLARTIVVGVPARKLRSRNA
ncbi:putative acetyltransferase [Rubripirellula reticaptiva]|uniref:Putative acetyltransferase n=2 Tax=Rubripirellula reticaptiva TaxID=2528013 RepID=A0A5C6F1U5_9BACT|nr:putative acetyltransferase [Rubripirellula reticaptiva]